MLSGSTIHRRREAADETPAAYAQTPKYKAYSFRDNVRDIMDFYRAGDFRYNARFWVAFLPSLLVVLSFGGKLTLGTVIIGLLVVFLCDMLGSKMGALIALWGMLFVTEIGLVLTAIPLIRFSLINVFFVFNIAFFILLTGVWASLQFRWIIEQQPIVALGMERTLFACMPISSSFLLTWAAVGLSGFDNAAYYLSAALLGNFLLFSFPMRSSFVAPAPRDPTSTATLVIGPFEAAVHLGVLLLVPMAFHAAIYHRVLFSPNGLRAVDCLLLTSAPVLAVALWEHGRRRRHGRTQQHVRNSEKVWTPRAHFLRSDVDVPLLWWAPPAVQRMATPLTLTAAACAVLGIEIRVIFYAFSHLIALFPPWSYVAVTIATYSAAALVALHAVGYYRGDTARAVWRGLSVVGATATAVTVGLPWQYVPLPVAAGFFLVEFYFERKLRYYLVFVGGAAVALAWFIKKNYWFLEFSFGERGQGMSLQTLAVYLYVVATLSLFLPGLILLNRWRFVNAILVAVHTVGTAYVEAVLCSGGGYGSAGGGVEVYPWYLVVFTSLVGVVVCRRLRREQRIPQFVAHIGYAVYPAKLGLLVSMATPGGVRGMVPSLFVLIFCAIAPLCYYEPNKMPRSRAYVWAFASILAAFALYRVPAALLALVATPTPMATFGLVLVCAAVGCMPMVLVHFADVSTARNATVFVFVAGLLIAVVSTATAGPATSVSPLAGPRWPMWALIVAGLLTLAAMTSVLPITRSPAARFLYVIVAGLSIGAYLAASYLPPPVGSPNALPPLSMFAVIVMFGFLLALFIVFTMWPTPATARAMPLAYCLWMSLLPAAFVMAGMAYSPKLTGALASVLAGAAGGAVATTIANARLALLALYATANILLSLLIKFKLAGGLSIAAELIAPPQPAAAKARRKTSPILQAQKLPNRDDEWLPAAANIASLAGFILAVCANVVYLNGSPLSIIVLSPLLLLLQRDQYMFKHLTDERRYFPQVAMSVAILTVMAVVRLAGSFAVLGWLKGFKTAALLVPTVPANALFVKYLWEFRRQSQLVWVVLAPMLILATIFADVPIVQLLGFFGLIEAAVQYFWAQRIRKRGLREL